MLTQPEALVRPEAPSGSTIAGRLGAFVRGSYPPVPSVLFAVAWAYGVTGLFAALDPRPAGWRPDAGTALAAATLLVDLLLLRALDDLRDLDYDRRLNPDRALASGAVHPRDLVWLFAVGSGVLVGLNATAGWRLVIIVAQLAYVAATVAAHQRWQRPAGANLPANLLVSLPAPVLLQGYLYAGYLHITGRSADWRGIVAIAVVVLASGHVELAKKITREPRPGERTYVESFGLVGTTVAALAAPLLSTLILVVGTLTFGSHPAPGWTLVAVAPLVLPSVVAWRFWRARLPRWPPAAPTLFLLLTFVAYLTLGLA